MPDRCAPTTAMAISSQVTPGDKAQEVAGKSTSAIRNMEDKASELAQEAGHRLEEAAQKAGHKAQEAASKVGHLAHELADKASDKLTSK